jgi:PIN domain nuclease of toxin-antitoxin system
MIYAIDTHALIWFLEGSQKLGGQARRILRDQHQKLILPTIVLAEAKDLSNKGKTVLPFREILEAAADPRCMVYPLDLDVVRAMPSGLDIHDALICATVLVGQDVLREEVRLITRDEVLVQAGLVQTIW